MKINALQAEDRPREKMRLHGVESLTDAELLALLLVFGTKGVSALELSQNVLNIAGGIDGIAMLNEADLVALPGVGHNKAKSIIALGELFHRLNLGEPGNLKRELLYLCHNLPQVEVCYAFVLSMKNEVIAKQLIGKGSDKEMVLSPHEALHFALSHGAKRFCLAHTHPSGNPFPSRADIVFTKLLRELSSSNGIELTDHYVISREGVFSFKDQGLFQTQS